MIFLVNLLLSFNNAHVLLCQTGVLSGRSPHNFIVSPMDTSIFKDFYALLAFPQLVCYVLESLIAV